MKPWSWNLEDGASVLLSELAALLGGAVIAVLLAALSDGGARWSDGFQLVGYMLAATVLASVLGLVFAVPRAREDNGTNVTGERYLANSNLEQISDWLTKILVGAGLVQLAALPDAVERLGNYLGSGIDMKNADAMSVVFCVYGVGIGFVFTYVWARLSLRVLLERSEFRANALWLERTTAEATRAAAERTKETVLQSLRQATEGAAPEPEQAVRAAAASAAGLVVQRGPAAARGRLLWVDDNPSNNLSIAAALRGLGVEVELARSTDEALTRLKEEVPGLVITDLGRQESGLNRDEAGLALLSRMRTEGINVPVIVYAGYRAVQRRKELLGAGAILATDRPSEVFNKAVEILIGRQ